MIYLNVADLNKNRGTRDHGRRRTGARLRTVGVGAGCPRSSVFGRDAYESLVDKAAALLLQSLARNHGLVDGNERLALAATIAFLGINGRRLTFTTDQAYDFIIEVASGELAEVAAIAERLRHANVTRGR